MTELEQNLNTILEEKQTKIIPENIKEGITVLGIEGNYSGLDTSDATATESDISEGKTAYVNGNRITGTLINQNITRNIFVKNTEPEIKDGFWFKNEEEIKIDSVIGVEHINELINSEEWESKENYNTLPYDGALGWECARVGDWIYLFGTDAVPTQAYRYNYKENITEKLTDTPRNSQRCMVSAVGTDVYIIGGGVNSQAFNDIYKYDTLTGTYTLCKGTLNLIDTLGASVTVGTDIYIFGGYAGTTINPSQKAYRYDTLKDATFTLPDIPSGFAYHRVVEYKGNIYLIGGMYGVKVVYKYNIESQTYTRLTDLPFDFNLGNVEKIGNKIYIFCNQFGCTYDMDNDTYEMLSEGTNTIMHFASSLVFKDNAYKILIFGEGEVKVFNINLQILENNSLIIIKDSLDKTTQLYNDPNLDGKLPISFKDAGIYSIEHGYILDTERHYGNDMEWIPIE